jgi:glycosyltransferase involved in cell wall biosynthesis
MRVLQLIKTADGASWAWRQVRELVRQGHEIHVALPGDGPMLERYREVGASVHVQRCDFAHAGSPMEFWRQARELRRLVRSVDPDIVHSHFVGTSMMMRIALANLPVPRLFQVPGPLHLESALTRRAELITSGRSDYWAASCRFTRQIYVDAGIEPDRIGLAYYGTDLTQSDTAPKGTLRSALGIPENDAIVGMVSYAYAPKRWLGYRRGIKGHEDLIDALAILRARGVPVHGVFVGGAWAGADGYYRGIVEYGREKLGSAGHFLGTRDDVTSLYGEFDVAVHPSHSENLGGAGESLALAIPTITTDVGGFPDIVINDKTGWSVPPKSPAALADAISLSLDDRERSATLARNGQQLVREMLNVGNTAAQVGSIYSAIIERRALPC